MKLVLLISPVALCLTAAACSFAESGTTDPGPDSSVAQATVVLNAEVYTFDSNGAQAEAFAYDAERIIVAVGSEAEVRATAGDDAVVIDAGGNLVLPGFQDAHVHVPEAGLNLDVCFFLDGLTLDDYGALAVECAEEQAGADWVTAAGASLFDLRDTDESPLAVLDRAIPDRPALVLDNLGHAVWTNSLGLEAAVPDLETAIAMHTIDAAYALGHDDRTGSIEVGKFADFIVLDQNLFDIALDEIDETRILYTAVAGAAVHQARGFLE